jgi:hypothetical protein
MRRVLGCLVFCVACGGSGNGAPSLDGSWAYTSAGGAFGYAYTFNSDGTYSAELLSLTSANSEDAYAETGTFTSTSDTIALTPNQASCGGPDPAYAYSYSLQGDTLVLTDPSGIVSYERTTASSGPNESIVLGCFDSTGAFTPTPMAPVSD